MKSEEILKNVIATDFSEKATYRKMMKKIKKRKRNRRIKLILLPTSFALVISLIFIQSGGTEYGSFLTFTISDAPEIKITPNTPDSSYFNATIKAGSKEYSLDTEVKFIWEEDEELQISTGYTFPFKLENVKDTTLSEDGTEIIENMVITQAYKLNLVIQGDNIDKIIYKLDDSKGNALIYRAISGELSGFSHHESTDEYYANKKLGDLSMEDRQKYLDAINYTKERAEDMTFEQFVKCVQEYFNFYLSNSDSKEKFREFVSLTPFSYWDIIDKGSEIELPVNEQSDRYTLFLTKHVPNPEDFTSLEEYGKFLRQQDNSASLNSVDGLINNIAKETAIKIQIVYKNGTVHEKQLTFKVKHISKSYTDELTGETTVENLPTLEAVLK